MTTTDNHRREEPRRLALVDDAPAADKCESCGRGGPVGYQQVGDDPDVVFLLCGPCGSPAVNAGIGWWLAPLGVRP